MILIEKDIVLSNASYTKRGEIRTAMFSTWQPTRKELLSRFGLDEEHAAEKLR